jgi:hypothetical protein
MVEGRRMGSAELARELEVHVEELGSQRDHREVRRQVGDVDAPRHRALDLGAALAQHLGRVGVLPQIVDVAREAALARQQRRCVRDGAEAVGLVLAVEREVHADVVGGQAASGVACPRGGHHQARAGGHAVVRSAS